MARRSQDGVVGFQDKLERLINLAIQLVNDGIPEDQLVGGLETKNVGLHLSLASKEPDRFTRKSRRPSGERWQISVDVNPVIPKGEGTMEWTKPEFEEIYLNCEINSYANAEL